MEQVVPGVLQRLRAADIIRMAGLTTASLGQEYCRTGAVHSTYCRGAHITGVVEVPPVATSLLSRKDVGSEEIQEHVSKRCYTVEVELRSPTSWLSECQCNPGSNSLCPHAAALLYQWLARPSAFAVAAPPSTQLPQQQEESVPQKRAAMSNPLSKSPRALSAAKPVVAQHGPVPLGNVTDILGQMGLSELRSIGREYDLVTNGMNKQQLVEAIVAAMHRPEAVRRVVATLEKPQRQLLAALTLAGGAMTDDEMRGLFERFSLGAPGQLQGVLTTLESKGLLLRTSLNSSPQQRVGLSGALLDVGWYVPAEVRSALRVSMPITPFDVQQRGEDNTTPVVMLAEPYRILAELLLVARALDGYQLDRNEEHGERNSLLRASNISALSRPTGLPSTDGSTAVPPPPDMPSTSLISLLQALLERPPAFLRFAVSLLRLTDILHKDDSGTPFLRVLPNAAQVLLGSSYAEVLRELFELWLTQASYENLIDLQEEGLRIRCRATSLNHPVLRPGELDAENSEARQSLVALLAQVPGNQWINFTAFARFIYRLNPLFLQKRQRLFSTPHWWLEQEEGRPLRPTQLNDWLRAEAHYLARLVRGPLYWWGACDIALSQDGRLLAFRLTPLANWLFDGVEAEDAPDSAMPAQALEIVNTEEVLVYCDLRAWPLIELMEIFAEVAGVRGGRLCYRLTPKAFANALGRGARPAELFAALRAAHGPQAGNALSQLLAQLERWAASYGRIRVYTGVTLLEVADAMVMRELSTTNSLDEQIVQSVHPTLHILKKSGAQRLVENLKRHGQAPLLHNEEFLYGAE